jgi:hypothetical protein
LPSCHLSKNLKIRIYRTVLLPVILYGHETWSLTVREKLRLMVFENRVLGRFRHKREEVVGDRRRLHNEELNNFCSLLNIVGAVKSRKMR